MNNDFILYISIFIGLLAYIPYFRATIKGTTRPHIYTWLVIAILNLVMFSIQSNQQLSLFTLSLLINSVISTVIMILALKNGTKDIVKIDGIFIAISLFSLLLWIFLQNGFTASILYIFINIFAFLPTFRKTWLHPKTETISTYFLFILRDLIYLSSFISFSIPELLPPAIMIIFFVLFVNIDIIRKLQTK